MVFKRLKVQWHVHVTTVLPGSQPLRWLNWRSLKGGKDEHRELVLLSSLSLLLFFTVVSSQLHCSWCILSPGSRSWSQGLLQRCGKRPYPSSLVPTHGGWTPAGRGLSSQLAARRRRWPRRGNSSSTLTEPGTPRTPASPAGWSPWTITMCDTNTDIFAVLSWENKVLPGQQTELLGHQPWPFHCLFPILKLWLLLGIPAEFQKYIGGCQFSNSALQMCFTQ